MIVYGKPFMQFLLTVPDFITAKVFCALMTKQDKNGWITTTRGAVADEIKISYRSAIASFQWLKAHGYLKERRIKMRHEFFLNPEVTTCGKNKQEKIRLWQSVDSEPINN